LFSRLTASVQEKQSRGTVKRILESNADIAEIKQLLVKISARIEAFVVSVVPCVRQINAHFSSQYESMIRVEIDIQTILTVCVPSLTYRRPD